MAAVSESSAEVDAPELVVMAVGSVMGLQSAQKAASGGVRQRRFGTAVAI